jgi:uncharacterized protein YndB with AHSA1/START domain
MSVHTATVVLETDIAGSPEAVFDAITDLRGYGRWLGESGEYGGTAEISDDPVRAGTTYTEPSSSGTRHGTVTELERPARVTFHQPMTLRPGFLGVLDIVVTYTLTPGAEGVHLRRVVTLGLAQPMTLLRALVIPRFRRESDRTMRALKAFVEARD